MVVLTLWVQTQTKFSFSEKQRADQCGEHTSIFPAASPPLPPPFPIPEPSETEQMPPQTTSSSTDEELIPDDYEEEDEEKKESYKKTGRAKPTTLGEALGSEAEGTEEALTGEGVENEVTETEDEQTAAEVVTEIPEKGVGPEPSHVDVTTAEESYEKDLGWPDLDITPTEQTVVQATQTPEKSNHELGGEGKAGATSDSAEGGSREVTKGLTKGSMTEETDDGYDVWVMPTVPFPGRRMLTESEISPFTVYDDDADWATADRNCANRGSELAVPRDDADKASIEALLNNKAQAAEAWVGLRQVVGDEVFRDKSGTYHNLTFSSHHCAVTCSGSTKSSAPRSVTFNVPAPVSSKLDWLLISRDRSSCACSIPSTFQGCHLPVLNVFSIRLTRDVDHHRSSTLCLYATNDFINCFSWIII